MHVDTSDASIAVIAFVMGYFWVADIIIALSDEFFSDDDQR